MSRQRRSSDVSFFCIVNPPRARPGDLCENGPMLGTELVHPLGREELRLLEAQPRNSPIGRTPMMSHGLGGETTQRPRVTSWPRSWHLPAVLR